MRSQSSENWGCFLKYWLRFLQVRRPQSGSLHLACLIVLVCAVPTAWARTSETDRPVPILTGNAGFFTNVSGGQTELVPEVNPVLLVPLGDHWLIESRAEFEGDFQRSDGGGPYGGMVNKEVNYLQADYIANRYLTVTAGRFLTPFGIYNERLYPIWIRSLPEEPLIFPIATGSSDGVMLRGGFSLNSRINLNYATYFSTLSTVNKLTFGPHSRRPRRFLPSRSADRSRRFLGKAVAGRPFQLLRISFCLAAATSATQSAL